MQARRLAVFVNRGKQQIILYIRVANATLSLGQAHVILNPLPSFFFILFYIVDLQYSFIVDL